MWTKMNIISAIALLCVIMQYNTIHAKRILTLAITPSYSHQIIYHSLCLELNKRGHEIVFITTNAMRNSSLVNYTEIDIYHLFTTKFNISMQESLTRMSLTRSYFDAEKFVWNIATFIHEEFFKEPEVKKLYAADSNEHFDAVIVAQGTSPSLNAFAHRFKAPLIGISSLDVFNQIRYMYGSLVLPSHHSNWQTNMQIESNMSFWQRLVNFYEVWMQIYHWINVFIPSEDAIVKKYLGEDVPSILDITRNMSVYLVHKNPTISIPRQEQANVIFFHGAHIKASPPPLSKELKQLLDKASEGFIYVSMGSNVKWDYMPENTHKTFIEAFASLPWKVVWKNNPDLVPKKLKNIYVSKWFPQQSVLAHPNIKLFIYQGGLQSTEEAIYYEVPLIGYPVIWDQKYQVRNVKRLGIGTYFDYKNLSKEKIVATVYEVINNKRYKEQVKELSKVYKDTPYDTLQNAVWWIEHIMRHNGVTRFQDRIFDYPWYQRYDWDIIGFFAVAAFTTSLISFYMLFQILRSIYKRYRILYRKSQYYIKLKNQ